MCSVQRPLPGPPASADVRPHVLLELRSQHPGGPRHHAITLPYLPRACVEEGPAAEPQARQHCGVTGASTTSCKSHPPAGTHRRRGASSFLPSSAPSISSHLPVSPLPLPLLPPTISSSTTLMLQARPARQRTLPSCSSRGSDQVQVLPPKATGKAPLYGRRQGVKPVAKGEQQQRGVEVLDELSTSPAVKRRVQHGRVCGWGHHESDSGHQSKKPGAETPHRLRMAASPKVTSRCQEIAFHFLGRVDPSACHLVPSSLLSSRPYSA